MSGVDIYYRIGACTVTCELVAGAQTKWQVYLSDL